MITMTITTKKVIKMIRWKLKMKKKEKEKEKKRKKRKMEKEKKRITVKMPKITVKMITGRAEKSS